jgi:hypothetical protein
MVRGHWLNQTAAMTLETKTGPKWTCEMTRDEIDRQQSEDMNLLVEVSDETLEAICGGLMQ